MRLDRGAAGASKEARFLGSLKVRRIAENEAKRRASEGLVEHQLDEALLGGGGAASAAVLADGGGAAGEQADDGWVIAETGIEEHLAGGGAEGIERLIGSGEGLRQLGAAELGIALELLRPISLHLVPSGEAFALPLELEIDDLLRRFRGDLGFLDQGGEGDDAGVVLGHRLGQLEVVDGFSEGRHGGGWCGGRCPWAGWCGRWSCAWRGC